MSFGFVVPMLGINGSGYYDELVVTGVLGPRWERSYSSMDFLLHIVYELLIRFPNAWNQWQWLL